MFAFFFARKRKKRYFVKFHENLNIFLFDLKNDKMGV